MQVSMPSASTSTFIMPSAIDIVLVPFDEVAVVHRGRADGHDGVEPVARQHEAADMLREMARKSHDLVGEAHRLHDRCVLRIEHALAHLLFLQLAAPASPHAAGHGGGDVFGQAEHLADFADGAARAIADDGGGERGACRWP